MVGADAGDGQHPAAGGDQAPVVVRGHARRANTVTPGTARGRVEALDEVAGPRRLG